MERVVKRGWTSVAQAALRARMSTERVAEEVHAEKVDAEKVDAERSVAEEDRTFVLAGWVLPLWCSFAVHLGGDWRLAQQGVIRKDELGDFIADGTVVGSGQARRGLVFLEEGRVAGAVGTVDGRVLFRRDMFSANCHVHLAVHDSVNLCLRG
jgi:hypothetical protein